MEALIVGIVTAIIGFVISTALMYTRPGFSLQKYKFWPLVLLAFFVTGVVCHLGFEWLGLNKAYCKQGYACRRLRRSNM